MLTYVANRVRDIVDKPVFISVGRRKTMEMMLCRQVMVEDCRRLVNQRVRCEETFQVISLVVVVRS